MTNTIEMGAKPGVTGRNYEQDDAFRSRHVVNAILSPDGSFAIYELSETVPGKTKDEDKQLTAIWRVELAGGEPRRLTARDKNSSSARITPDGRSLLFLSARDQEQKTAQIHRLPLDGGEVEEVTTLEQGVASFALSPDGEWIAFTAVEKAPKTPGPNDHVRIRRAAYRTDTVPGYIQDVLQALYLMPAKGGEHKALTAHEGIIGAVEWSPDSREIAISTTCKEQAATVMHGDISVVDRDGHARTVVDHVMAMGLFWSADGKQIGYISWPGGIHSKQPQLFVVDRNGGTPVCRTSHLDLPILPLGGHNPAYGAMHFPLTADGKSVIAAITKGGETGIYTIALSGPNSSELLFDGPRVVRPTSRVGAKLLLVHQDLNTAPELWIADLNTREERLLTRHNDEWHAQIAWPQIEHVKVESAPGVEIEGWVLKPSQGEAPFKTVLIIHGGPHGGYGYTFNEDFHELVGAGYAVAFMNPRGSTGYGDEFTGAIVGCWGHPELQDFNAFLDELVRRGIADADKLGVTGLSGGGHLSGWLIGQTDRFKAAIPEQGVYNMFSMYGVSDAGLDLITLEMGGPPHEQVQRYWDLSPIAHAHKVKTPTLLIQGENDIRCPMEQAEQLYTILKYNGCEVELLRLKNCNHGLEIAGPPHLRRFRMDAIKDWFARHIN